MDAMVSTADDDLVLKSRSGDLDAFNQLVARYQVVVFNLCARLLANREAAEDATQETFLSAYRALSRFEGGSFRSWLLRIAANQAKDELRRRKRKDRAGSLDEMFDTFDAPVEVPDAAERPDERVQRASVSNALQRALMQLPFDQRRAIVLVDVMGYPYEEAARIAETSPGTIKSRIHRGREKLRTIVRRDPELFGLTGR
jgi:RNA polymerase sigma-70 factor (ECF subfamily)